MKPTLHPNTIQNNTVASTIDHLSYTSPTLDLPFQFLKYIYHRTWPASHPRNTHGIVRPGRTDRWPGINLDLDKSQATETFHQQNIGHSTGKLTPIFDKTDDDIVQDTEDLRAFTSGIAALFPFPAISTASWKKQVQVELY